MFHHVSMMIVRYRMKTETSNFCFYCFLSYIFHMKSESKLPKTRELSRRKVQSNQADCFFLKNRLKMNWKKLLILIAFNFLILFKSYQAGSVSLEPKSPPITECPCLTPSKGGRPWKTEKKQSLEECHNLCWDKIERCVGFSYCVSSERNY